MDRGKVVLLISILMDSMKDLEGSWRNDPFQQIRVGAVRERIIEDCLIRRDVTVVFAGRDLVEYYRTRAERINKDPLDYARRAIAICDAAQQGKSDESDRKELLSFCHLVKDCFLDTLGR